MRIFAHLCAIRGKKSSNLDARKLPKSTLNSETSGARLPDRGRVTNERTLNFFNRHREKKRENLITAPAKARANRTTANDCEIERKKLTITK